jgi:hypothetical protein
LEHGVDGFSQLGGVFLIDATAIYLDINYVFVKGLGLFTCPLDRPPTHLVGFIPQMPAVLKVFIEKLTRGFDPVA